MNQNAKRRFQAGLRGTAPQKPEHESEIEPNPAPTPSMAHIDIGPDGGRFELDVSPDQAGQRLDRFMAESASHPSLSRSRLKHLIEAGALSINEQIITDAATKLRAGQHICLMIPAAAPAEPQGEDMPLDIVFEDEHLIIINKPAGLVVHPAAGHENGTLVNALIAHCGDSLSGIGGIKRPGIVHRLDKDTSGLLVVAKTDATHQGLCALFADHGRTMDLTRNYMALVWGKPERSQGTINAPLGRHPHHREKQAVLSEEKGREAITHFAITKSFGSPPLISLVSCALETGRTHQIRVHMSHSGCPIVGDELYGSGFRTKAKLLPETAQIALTQLGRQALHAQSLGFTHPITGEELLFEAEIPKDIATLIATLEEYC
jgi:23S rRNA pseudouridine1911/1915/1917 synthase